MTSPTLRGFFARMSRARMVVGAFALSGALLALRAAAAPENETPEQLLAQLDADVAHKVVLAAPLEKARSALSRARAMDHSGDQAHAALMRAVAHQWLAVASDLVRAVDIEAKADQKEKALDDLETKVTRGQALLEETAARRARAQALLEQVERAEPAPPTATAPKGKEKPGTAGPPPAPAPGTPSIPPRPEPLQLTPPAAAPVAPGRAPAPPPVPGTAPKPAPPHPPTPAVENPRVPAPAAPSREPTK